MIYWKCPTCLCLERTSGDATLITHTHAGTIVHLINFKSRKEAKAYKFIPYKIVTSETIPYGVIKFVIPKDAI